MRQTLFYIPHEIAGLGLFGAGWLLIGWGIFSAVVLGRYWFRKGWTSEATAWFWFQLLVAAILWLLIPRLEVGQLGLPIRGYGVMMLLGVVAGTLAAAYRARQAGIDHERIYGLLMWFLVAGIGGARLFYVVEYFEDFRRPTLAATLSEIARFTEGGLVVYGALVGAAIAFWAFARRHALSPLRLADVIAPSLMLGLAFGRIGCLLNGCCYGKVCEQGPIAITFPRYSAPERRTFSPPYADHLTSGRLHGILLGPVEDGVVVARVEPTSPPAATQLTPGTVVQAINGQPVRTLSDVRRVLLSAGPDVTLVDAQRRSHHWSMGVLPSRSLPVHPAQAYSALNALLIFLVGWFYFPLRRHAGEVFGLVMTLYPITRFLLEFVRNDEAGQFGTTLTISQWVSLLVVALMVPYWAYVWTARNPRAGVDIAG
jgi:phosphatidylglycerol:prolipoprotein diacylglycerol transferase